MAKTINTADPSLNVHKEIIDKNKVIPLNDDFYTSIEIPQKTTPPVRQNVQSSIDEIIYTLPLMLKEPCNVFVDEVEKEVFLIGALGIISGLLPNYISNYDGKWIRPNLYVYILSGYGSGKGALSYCRIIGEKIHAEKKEQAREDLIRYQRELEIYNKGISTFKKSNDIAEPPQKPILNKKTCLFIPVNNSKSGLIELLQHNNNNGILFETEGDTLADAIKQDYGNFSDILRKAFHHEPIDYYTKGQGELIELINPCVSTVLSSTFDQLLNLIPSIENGLYSRFLYYFLKQEPKFNDVFNTEKTKYVDDVKMYSEKYYQTYKYLESLTEPKYFSLTENQQIKFVNYFDNRKRNIINSVGENMAGTINRMGIIAYRLMMIFTALRRYESIGDNKTIYCTDDDFMNTFKILERLEEHSISVYEKLGNIPDKKQLALEMIKHGNSLRDIEKATGINRGTLSKWNKKSSN